MGLWVDAPTMPVHFLHLYLFGELLANIHVVLDHFIPQASLIYLLLFYLFYSVGLFAKSFGLSQPNYHIFTFYYFSGLLAFRLTQ